MTKYCILLLLTGFSVTSQNIISALTHTRNYELRTSPIVSEIKSDITYYRTDETEHKKSASMFNDKNNLTSELRYDDEGTLTSRLTSLYDNTGVKKTSSKYETWNSVVGHTVEISEYQFDNKDNLIKTVDKNQFGNIFRISNYENDEQGNPIKLTLEKPNQGIIGFEIATYNYDNNTGEISILDNNNNVVTSYPMRINFSERTFSDLIYNEHDDLIQTSNGEYSYKYDKHNNWVKRTHYTVRNGVKTKDETILRKIKYKK